MRGFTHYTTKAACDLWVGPASSVNKAAEGWLEPRSSANLDKLCNITDKHTRDVGLFTSDFRYKRGELESFRKASIKESSRTTKTRAGIDHMWTAGWTVEPFLSWVLSEPTPTETCENDWKREQFGLAVCSLPGHTVFSGVSLEHQFEYFSVCFSPFRGRTRQRLKSGKPKPFVPKTSITINECRVPYKYCHK